MSIICTEVTNTANIKLFARRPNGLVWATIDPNTIGQLPFPSDYKYFSCLLPRKYAVWADRIHNFKVRPDDIWITGYPKSGTTWTHNIADQLKIQNLDFTAKFVQVELEILEVMMYFDNIAKLGNKAIELMEKREKWLDELDALPSPRIIKSHLPAYLLPKGIWSVQPKIIYISRDVKDAAVSRYYMLRNSHNSYNGPKADFFDDFRHDVVLYSSFHEHISSFYQLSHLKHLLLLTYEELNANTFENVKRMSQFLDCSHSDEQLHQLVEHVSFGNMQHKINMSISPNLKFCRKGKIGGYVDDMDEEQIKQFDEWTMKKKQELNLP